RSRFLRHADALRACACRSVARPLRTAAMAEQKATNIVWHPGAVTRADREQLNGHRGSIVWLTGLSGSGKSTIAVELEKRLWDRGVRAFILDGDNIRHGHNKNLGFSPADRTEHIRQI